MIALKSSKNLTWLFTIFLLAYTIQGQTTLSGIRCDLEPAGKVFVFKMPVLPSGNNSWQITNDFGNRVTNRDVPGLPNGTWQHTGVDYLLAGKSVAIQNQPVYAAANGIVIFSTKSNPNPIPTRGGLIIIRHLAPKTGKFVVTKYDGKAGSYSEFETKEILTYYLHLDEDNISVKTGDEVKAGERIAQTYDSENVGAGKKYAYVPHLHFEVWSTCSKSELNGYEPDGVLKKSLRNPVIDPESFLTFVRIKFELPNNSPFPPISTTVKIPTLFLFDVSGSMNDNDKIGQARASSLTAMREIQENKRLGRGDTPVSVWTFSGECTPNAARQILPFTENLTQAENTLGTKISRPDGGTHLPQGIEKATAQVSDYLSRQTAISEGRIVLLSDGQSTCGEIRPAGIYSQARTITVKKIRFLTIGFDVAPGSAAERDLQYLASSSGGQYFPAQNRQQLARAFEKTIRVYLPKTVPNASPEFENVVSAITNRDFQRARKFAAEYLQKNPADVFGYYNLAVALEASSRYKGAAENYRKYLQLAPDAADRRETEARIAKLEQDWRDQFFYYQMLLQSDLDYLKAFYQKIFNREIEKNAAEFAGFVAEKQEFYANLTDILEIRSTRIERDTQDLSASLGILNRRVGLPSFDRDAVSLLTIPIGHLEDVIERIGIYADQNLK